jgi:hypothetical protein
MPFKQINLAQWQNGSVFLHGHHLYILHKTDRCISGFVFFRPVYTKPFLKLSVVASYGSFQTARCDQRLS